MSSKDSMMELTPEVKFKKKTNANRFVIGMLIVALLGLVIGLAVGIPLSKRDTSVQQDAKTVLDEVPLIDGHNDLPWQYRQFAKNKVFTVNLRGDTRIEWPDTINMTHPKYPYLPPQTDINRLKQGKVGAQFWAAFADCSSDAKDAVRQGMDMVDTIYKFVERYPDVFKFVTSADGIMEAFEEGKIGSLIGLEGGHMIGNTLGVLRNYYRLGVRYMTMTHSCDTDWATNWKVDIDNSSKAGLSEFGKVIIKEMNRIGMMIDLSHVSRQTMLDSLETTEAPVIYSHSSAFAVCNHYRNVQDDVLEKTKENKGLVMINFFNNYINCDWNTTNTTTEHVISHINYVKDKIGVDYVGIGADYDGVPFLPQGLEDVSKFPNLFKKLKDEHQWSDEDLKKLSGKNLLRVFRKVEEVRDSKRNVHPYEDIISHDEIRNPNCTTSF